MLTLILLGLLGGSGWFGTRQFKRARRAEARLRRIAAASDSEVLAVLEASDTPLAQRLLLEARAEHPSSTSLLSEHGWKALVEDLKSYPTEVDRFHALEDYVSDGVMVSESQYLHLLTLFSDVWNGLTRRLLRRCRIERRRA